MDCLPQIHAVAIHAEAGYRGDTPGIGILCRRADLLAGAGIFSNSVGQASHYAMAGWQPLHIAGARVGVVAGLIDGYPYKSGAAFPFAAAVISYPLRWGEIHITVIPKVTNQSPATAGFSFSIKGY